MSIARDLPGSYVELIKTFHGDSNNNIPGGEQV